ncbi:MAG: dienelactone hydrolase family protein [Bacteroidales bacterium]|nr:dienelactone hydrolase family protein [Bacteroidales bacterium]
MLKTQNRVFQFRFSIRHLVIAALFIWSGVAAIAQPEYSLITYPSGDSLLITADDYFQSDTLPYLILLHEQGSSRGEFTGIVHRFQKMNFNCLVPDLRNGGNANFTSNETAVRSRELGFSRNRHAVELDILASISHAYNKSGKRVVLLGAGANASLALKAAKEQETVQAVIALSPGEFFQPLLSVKDTIAGLQKPVLITATKEELPYMEQLAKKVNDTNIILFAPDQSPGERGTQALLPSNPSNSEYWFNILLFFKDLQ